ncbi:MAG: C10 family peptidase [Paludibacteraceae bacterium]
MYNDAIIKRFLTLSVCVCWGVLLLAAPRTVQEAATVAGQFLTAQQVNMSPAQRGKRTKMSALRAQPMRLAYTQMLPDRLTPACYVFSRAASDSGFVIVSADDRVRTILAYSEEGEFRIDEAPDNLRFWLNMYADEVAAMPAVSVRREAAPAQDYPVVAPLLGTIKWGQGSPYNDLCPTVDGVRCVVGCVATAASQIMYYHRYPTVGTGSHAYEWNGQTLSADFGAATYSWAYMQPSYGNFYTPLQARAVATICSHVGIACDMNYGTGESGAVSLKAMSALVNYFGYDAAIRPLPKKCMSEKQILSLVAADLQAGQPVFMTGCTRKDEGHAFVCDGMQADGYLHINWGWNGTANGYFALSALNPENQGTGGSVSDEAYTENVDLYIGIRPDQGGEVIPLITVDSILYLSDTHVSKTDNLSFRLTYFNNASIADAKGDVYAVLLREEESEPATSVFCRSYSLSAGYHYTKPVLFSCSLADAPAGDYILTFATTPTGSSNLYPILSAEPRGEYRLPVTLTADSVFVGTPIEEDMRTYSLRIRIPEGNGFDTSEGITCYYWGAATPWQDAQVQLQLLEDSCWMADIRTRDDSIQFILTDAAFMQMSDESPVLGEGEHCLLMSETSASEVEGWALDTVDCDAFDEPPVSSELVVTLAAQNGFRVQRIGNAISVCADAEADICLLDASGRLLASALNTMTAQFVCPSSGLYIVRCNTSACKLFIP